jgi:excisionase family DNA binding protein
MQTTEKFLTLEEVADYARVPLRRIREALRNHEIDFLDFSPPGSTRPKMRRVTQAAVDRWLQSLSQQKEPQIL